MACSNILWLPYLIFPESLVEETEGHNATPTEQVQVEQTVTRQQEQGASEKIKYHP